MRLFALAALCLLLVGCAVQPLASNRAAEYKRVGVLSVMGPDFEVKAVGITAFGNDYKSLSLDVGADDALTAATMQALSRRYSAVDLRKYRDAYVRQPRTGPLGTQATGSLDVAVGDVVHQLMAAERLDAYVIVVPTFAQVGTSNQNITGVGVVKVAGMFSGDAVLLHAAYELFVVDGKDFAIAAKLRAVPNGQSGPATLIVHPPVNAPYAEAPPEFLSAPEANKDKIKAALAALIEQNVPQTLQQTHLLP